MTMPYTTTYTDEDGKKHTYTITDDDSIEAIRNDYRELMRRYNPRRVRIERMPAQSGEAAHLKLTVLAPSHYLTAETDTTPKPCDSMSCEIVIYMGYPLKGLRVYYPKDHFLASPNVFRHGAACIDKWIPYTSSLLTVTDKLVMDMIHNPTVTRYESPANQYVINWHKEGVANGAFPTIDPREITTAPPPAMPSRRSAPANPPMPSRRR